MWFIIMEYFNNDNDNVNKLKHGDKTVNGKN